MVYNFLCQCIGTAALLSYFVAEYTSCSFAACHFRIERMICAVANWHFPCGAISNNGTATAIPLLKSIVNFDERPHRRVAYFSRGWGGSSSYVMFVF